MQYEKPQDLSIFGDNVEFQDPVTTLRGKLRYRGMLCEYMYTCDAHGVRTLDSFFVSGTCTCWLFCSSQVHTRRRKAFKRPYQLPPSCCVSRVLFNDVSTRNVLPFETTKSEAVIGYSLLREDVLIHKRACFAWRQSLPSYSSESPANRDHLTSK